MVFAKSERAEPVKSSEPSIWFGVPVWSVRLADYERHNRMILKSMDRLMDQGTALTRSNVGGWHSHDQLQTDGDFKDLCKAIGEACFACASYLEFDSENYELVIREMWLNRNRTGDYNTAHVHPNAMLSGAYYVDIPEEGGFIEFLDPAPARQIATYPVKKKTAATAQKVEYRVKEGALLIFPAWLPHAVQPNRASKPRVSLSFNVAYRSKS